MIDPVQLNLPPTIENHTRCAVCLREIPRNVANRKYCTNRCRKASENKRKRERDKELTVELNGRKAGDMHPALRARANLTHEQILVYCAVARANPMEMVEFPGLRPAELALPEGFTTTQKPESWCMQWDPLGGQTVMEAIGAKPGEVSRQKATQIAAESVIERVKREAEGARARFAQEVDLDMKTKESHE